MDFNPASSAPLDSDATNRLKKMERVMVNVVKYLHSQGARSARKDEDEDTDYDNNSLSSFNRSNLLDFLKGAQR